MPRDAVTRRLRSLSRCLALAAIAGALAASPAFACDAALDAAVAAKPNDADARDALARSCARAGRADAALAYYEELLKIDSGNVDWLLGKSQALIALQRPREALPLLERARQVAPAYEDVWRLNVTALEMNGEFARAEELLAEAARAFPQSAWPAERRQAMAEQRLLQRGTRLSIDASYEELSGGRPAWRGATVGIERRLADRRRVYAGLHLEERFDTRDEQVMLAFVDRLNDDWSYSVSGDVSPDAEVLPEWSLVLEAGRALPGDRSLGFRARHTSYSTVDVESLAATIEQYTDWLRVAYTLNASKPSGIDDPSFGHLLRFARDYGRDSHVMLALGFGEEAETVAPGVVQVTETRSVSLNGVHWRNAAWGFLWEAGWYEQGDLYDRIRVRLGLEHRF
ncbi:MAG: YaiO family outer membrane beta-barrel protein [Steroidobacteraceae bacterium]